MVLALARPQWQAPEAPSQPDPQVQVVVVIEYSEGMLAGDLLPSRLGRARNLVTEFFNGLAGAEIALIGFAGDAYLLSPMSRDQAAARRLLASLAPRHFLRQGADLNAALGMAMDQFSAVANNRLLLLVALGEHGPAGADTHPVTLSARLQARDIDLLVVGAGTSEGALLLNTDGQPRIDAVGAQLISRLNRQRLQSLADEGGGRYVGAGDRAGLQEMLAEVISETNADIPHGLDDPSQRRIELFDWLLLSAMLLLAWSLCREFSGRGVLAWRWHLRGQKTRYRLSTTGLLLVLVAGSPEPGRAQALWDTDMHPGDPYVEARALIQQLASTPRPTSANYLAFTEVVVEYALFHRGHAHPVIDSLLDDGFIAIKQGRALDAGNPTWDRLQTKLERLAQRAPATRPPDSESGDPANERADADALVDVAGDPAPPEASPEPDGNDVGGGKAEVFDEKELTNPTLMLPLHQLQLIREQATPADLFRARQENQPMRQGDAAIEDGAIP